MDPGIRPIPLAIPSLKIEGVAPPDANLEVAEVLRNDLQMSGLFEILDPRGYLEDPQASPLHPDKDSYAVWAAAGAECLIKGRLSSKGDATELELWFHDALRGKAVFEGVRFSTTKGELRASAHAFANMVFKELTGETGPFGTQIAYVMHDGKTRELAAVDMDGANHIHLTNARSLSLIPAWSRDGRYIYFTSYMMGDPDLFLLDMNTKKKWIVSKNEGIDLSGKDSPDGKELLMVLSIDGNPEIYKMEKSTREFTRLTNNSAIDVAPTWSRDGREIAFVSDRMGSPHIFIMDQNGKNVRRITYSGGHNGDPDWSPNGDVIAFSGKDANGRFQVFLADAKENGRVDQLTDGNFDTYDPSWSPDGRFLVVTSGIKGHDAIYILRLGSQEYTRISRIGEVASQPAWGPSLQIKTPIDKE